MLLSDWMDYSRDNPSDACTGGCRAFISETSGVITHSAKIKALYDDCAATDFPGIDSDQAISGLGRGLLLQKGLEQFIHISKFALYFDKLGSDER